MEREIKLLGITFLTAFLLSSCGDTKKQKKEGVAEEIDEVLEIQEPMAPEIGENMESVVDVVMSNPEYATLTKWLKSAELVNTMQSMSPVTLFAPTNDGFTKMPEEKVADLMQPQGRDRLISVLKYHTVEGTYDAEKLQTKIDENDGVFFLESLQGNTLKVTNTNGNLILTGELGDSAKIQQPNLRSSKGIIHGIDNVLLPN